MNLRRDVYPICILLVLSIALALVPAGVGAAASREDYQNIKEVVKQWMSTNDFSGYNLKASDADIKGRVDDDSFYNYRVCGTFSQFADIDWGGKWQEGVMMDSAGEVLTITQVAKALGYPAESWAKVVAQFEADTLRSTAGAKPIDGDKSTARIIDFSKRFWNVLNAYRAAHGSKLPKGGVNTTCGDEDSAKVGVYFHTTPPNGIAAIIPTFYYELCSKSGNPTDRAGCRYWRDVGAARKEMVRGQYFIQIKWQDGTVSPPRPYDLREVKEDQVVELARP